MSEQILPLGDRQTAVPQRLVHHPKWIAVLSVVLMIMGAAAIIVSPLKPLATELLVGWLLLLSGLVHGWSIFSMRRLWRIGGSAILAILSFVVGILLLFNPREGVLTFTLVLQAYFLAAGVTKIFTAFQDQHMSRSSWGITSGIVSLVIAGFIFWISPSIAVWALGVLFGIELVMTGITRVALYFTIRE
jgi:uncharacterized membrane protein HdeD (DUF308 family)